MADGDDDDDVGYKPVDNLEEECAETLETELSHFCLNTIRSDSIIVLKNDIWKLNVFD